VNREKKSELHESIQVGRWSKDTPPLLQDRLSQASLLRGQLGRYASALHRRWWIFAVSLLVIGGPMIFYAAIRPPTFQSQALMWLTGKPNLPSEMAYAVELTSYIGTQAALLKSSVIQFRAFKNLRSRFPALVGPDQNEAGANLPFDLTVRTLAKSSVLELRVTGSAPEPTRAYLDAVMDEYLAFKKESREHTSAGTLSSITEQVHDVEKQIQQQQAQVTLFQISNNISYLNEHGLSAGSHLSKLAEILSDLRTEHRLLEVLSPAQFKGLSEGAQATISDASVPGEKAAHALAVNNAAPQSAYYQALQQLQILKAKREEFSQVLRPTHSKMVKFNQEITGLEQLLKTLQNEGEQQALAQMENRKKSLELQIQNLENQYRAWETNAAEASRKLAEYDRMKQDMQRSQALYDRLLSLLQTVDLNNNLDQEILVPLAPASPARASAAKYRIAVEGVLLALLLATAAFVTLEFLDDRFASASEITLRFPVEVVGQIPRTPSALPKGLQRLLPVADAQPAFEESFRNLRSSLLFMSEQGAQPKMILITSAIPKEGKTTIAMNLAESLGASGSQVLLVDADFRRGAVHETFGVPRNPGLLGILCEGVPPARAVVPSGKPNLFVLPAGEASNNSSDILLRGRVDTLLHDLARRYDYVVIDSAPVLATDDAACIGPFTDGVFLVVRAAYTSARMTQEAWERLNRRNVKVLGLICNFASPSTDYYCHYSREYHNGNGSPTRP
jgi:capsular exopolysaccharide synthesis family protein